MRKIQLPRLNVIVSLEVNSPGCVFYIQRTRILHIQLFWKYVVVIWKKVDRNISHGKTAQIRFYLLLLNEPKESALDRAVTHKGQWQFLLSFCSGRVFSRNAMHLRLRNLYFVYTHTIYVKRNNCFIACVIINDC